MAYRRELRPCQLVTHSFRAKWSILTGTAQTEKSLSFRYKKELEFGLLLQRSSIEIINRSPVTFPRVIYLPHQIG
jgi:hypothetical protein